MKLRIWYRSGGGCGGGCDVPATATGTCGCLFTTPRNTTGGGGPVPWSPPARGGCETGFAGGGGC